MSELKYNQIVDKLNTEFASEGAQAGVLVR